MGLKSGASVTFNIENVKGLKDLKNICYALKKEKSQNSSGNQCLHVDVDCNWICNLQTIKNVHEVADFLESLSMNGFIVTPVCR